MVWLHAGILALASLLLLPGVLFHFDVIPKASVILIGTASLLALSTLRNRFAIPNRDAVLGKLFGALLLISAAWLVVSSFGSVHPWLSVFGSQWRRMGLVMQLGLLVFAWYVATDLAGRIDRVTAALRVLGGASSITAVYAILQYFGIDPLLPPGSYHIGEGKWQIVRPPSTLGYVSYFAAWQVFGVGCASTALVLETNARWRGLQMLAAALGTAGVLLSGTRAGIAALVVAALTGVLWRGRLLSRRTVAVTCAVCALGALFYFSPAGWKLRSRTRWFVEDPGGGARLTLWRDSIAMARNRWLTGWGPETFTPVFPKYQSRDLARRYPDFAYESPHNIFLDALVAQGIPGAVSFSAICCLAFVAAWRVRRKDAALSSALAALLAGCIVVNGFIVFTAATALAFLTAVALAVALASPASEETRRGPAARAAALTSAAGLAIVGVQLLAADAFLGSARNRLAAHDLAGSTQSFEAYQQWNPPGPAADLWYARALISAVNGAPDPLTRIQMVGTAGSAALRATHTSEELSQAWYTLAGFYALEDDARRAEESLHSAIAANPTWFKPRWVLAQLLEEQGRLDEAAEAARAAEEIAGPTHPEVRATLESIRRKAGAALDFH